MKINITTLENDRVRRGMSREDYSRMMGLHFTAYGKMLKSQSTTMKRIGAMATILRIKEKRLVVFE
jgi:hypothetical protein